MVFAVLAVIAALFPHFTADAAGVVQGGMSR
jgi:hypothetical protein